MRDKLRTLSVEVTRTICDLKSTCDSKENQAKLFEEIKESDIKHMKFNRR